MRQRPEFRWSRRPTWKLTVSCALLTEPSPDARPISTPKHALMAEAACRPSLVFGTPSWPLFSRAISLPPDDPPWEVASAPAPLGPPDDPPREVASVSPRCRFTSVSGWRELLERRTPGISASVTLQWSQRWKSRLNRGHNRWFDCEDTLRPRVPTRVGVGAHGPVPSPYDLGPLGERARNMTRCDLKALEGLFGGAKGCLMV